MAHVLSPAQAARAAAAYRALIKAQRFTFRGDDHAISAAHHQTRAIFSRFAPSAATSTLPPAASPLPQLSSSTDVDEHIQSAFEIATYLRQNVVQAVQKDDGVFALRFTAETERGSNDSIKAPTLNEARPIRPPLESTGNEGVKRRRRTPKPAAAPAPCCGGGAPAPSS